ncbi:MAG: hypothetical protein JW795_14915 [Chitinivibrionales bacterium]|nr:hypothetical protein [Chitinivibrionales bacterium]
MGIKNIDYLDSFLDMKIVACHCTGAAAIEKIGQRLGDRVMAGHTGFRYRLP